jgi:hypothetical protein
MAAIFVEAPDHLQKQNLAIPDIDIHHRCKFKIPTTSSILN